MGKTLYFEGAGNVPRGTVENCRIRTAFRTNDGRAIYLEMIGVEETEHTAPLYTGWRLAKPRKGWCAGIVDRCTYINPDESGEGFERVEYTRPHELIEYTKDNILAFVNSLGCSFDGIAILPIGAGYRVHRDGRKGYNLMEDYDKSNT